MHLFGVVQASSNLLEPHHYSDSKVLSHEFGVVRLYRTFSIYIVAGETRCAGCLCTCSGWFKHIEPRRTFPNHIITEIAKCVEFCHMSSGWFDHISVMIWFENVRRGLMCLNHPELVHKHPAYLVSPVTM